MCRATKNCSGSVIHQNKVSNKNFQLKATLYNTNGNLIADSDARFFSSKVEISKLPVFKEDRDFNKVFTSIVSSLSKIISQPIDIKKYNQNAKVGMTHALQEWEDDDNNKLKEYLKYHLEDKFLDASIDDDFIGLQTYTIVRYPKNIFLKIFNSLLLNIGFIRKFIFFALLGML